MEKIFNNTKINVYGGLLMKNKYIFMKRKYDTYIEYYIYKIEEILKDHYPVIYKSNRSYKLIVQNDFNKKMILNDHLINIELTNWDELYEITTDEFNSLFRKFIDYDDKLSKEIVLFLFVLENTI